IERKTKIEINITPGPEGVSQLAVVRRGRCADLTRDPQMDYLLFDVQDGESVSMIDIPAILLEFSREIIAVYAGDTPSEDEMVSCGDLPSTF
ncbi:MAG: hypothetical protein ACE5KI_02840, partial [Dehalococcoidia bacterium]